MLRAVHSNRVEELLSALDEGLPPADPFAPSTIIVGSKLVARWPDTTVLVLDPPSRNDIRVAATASS